MRSKRDFMRGLGLAAALMAIALFTGGWWSANIKKINQLTANTFTCLTSAQLDGTLHVDGAATIHTLTVDALTTSSTNFTASATVQGADLVATDDLTVGDDAVIVDKITVHGTSTLNGAVTTTGTLTAAAVVSTGVLTGIRTIVTVTTDTTLSDAQCRNGLVLLAAAQDDTTITVTMPTLVAGYDVVFVDADVTSGADLKIQMGASDTINGGTAAKAYVHGGGSTAKGIAHFIAADAVDFMLLQALEAGAVETTLPKWGNRNS